MDLDEIDTFLEAVGQDVDGSDGAWQFEIEEVRVACLTDARFDRMRLIAPVIEVDDMSEAHRVACLEANFHTALDGRYAISDGVLYAAFIHPLESLTETDFRSALAQVVSLVQTFGTSYSGGTLVFGVPTGGGGQPN